MSNLYPNIDPSNPTPGLGGAKHLTKLYPGPGVGVDLRIEMDKLLNSYGSYVMVRHYDITKHSIYWNEDTHEAVGGPAYEWTDHIVMAREVVPRNVLGAGELEQPAPPGILAIPYATFYLRWDPMKSGALVENVDEIYKFPWSKSRKPEPSDVVCTSRYNILIAIDMLGDHGRREYYACVCAMDVVGV